MVWMAMACDLLEGFRHHGKIEDNLVFAALGAFVATFRCVVGLASKQNKRGAQQAPAEYPQVAERGV